MSFFTSLVAGCGAKLLVTEVLTSTQTWTAPVGVNLLTSLLGKGQNGTPDTTYSEPDTYEMETYGYFIYDDGAEFSDSTFVSSEPTTADADIPPDFCYSFQPHTQDGHYNRAQCYFYGRRTIPGDSGGDEATTGNSTTGFGKTFPGGVGVTATPVLYSDVVITSGAPYNLGIPSGGSITITYYK